MKFSRGLVRLLAGHQIGVSGQQVQHAPAGPRRFVCLRALRRVGISRALRRDDRAAPAWPNGEVRTSSLKEG